MAEAPTRPFRGWIPKWWPSGPRLSDIGLHAVPIDHIHYSRALRVKRKYAFKAAEMMREMEMQQAPIPARNEV